MQPTPTHSERQAPTPRPTGRLLALAAVIAVLLVRAVPAAAADAASPWIDTDYTSVRLISATEAVGDDTRTAPLLLGLEFRLAEHWKVYWRSPGDAGYPPHPDWSASENVADVRMDWPAPVRFSVLGLETLGYTDAVVFPLRVTPDRPGAPVRLAGSVEYLACSDICVPYTADVALALPAGPANPSAHAHEINKYVSRVPGDGTAHGLKLEALGVVPAAEDTGPRLRLQVRSLTPDPLTDPDVYVEGPADLGFARPAVTLAEGGRAARLDIPVINADALDDRLDGQPFTVTFVDGARTAEKTFRAVPASTLPALALDGTGVGQSIWIILGLALLGGLILNLMPCVLPVLSIKLLGVMGHGGGEKRKVRLSFLASALGIEAAFLLLAGALVALQAGGAAIGWGIQFQQPWFLVAMAAVVVVFACNLWGFFEVRLPGAVADAGAHAAHTRGLGGHFLQGMLATLLATPCSAPFLGTAIGFALARGPAEIVSIFAVLGLGLALPFLLVAAVPRLATALPKPGRWIVVLRRVLGVALVATAAWLLSILGAQVGWMAVATAALFLFAATLALYLRHRDPHGLGRFGWGGAAIAIVLAFAGALAAPMKPAVTAANSTAPDMASGAGGTAGMSPDLIDALWVPFDRTAIDRLVAEGQIVFVDVTAEWCLTCQVNKNFVLAREDVFRRLARDGVVAMQGDWTLPDPVIADYLASFERYGIPFNAVYGPGAPEGITLPELLTPTAVLDALERAAGPATG